MKNKPAISETAISENYIIYQTVEYKLLDGGDRDGFIKKDNAPVQSVQFT